MKMGDWKCLPKMGGFRPKREGLESLRKLKLATLGNNGSRTVARVR